MAVTLRKFYWRAKTLTSYGESSWTDADFFYTPLSDSPSTSQLDRIYAAIVYNVKTVIKGNVTPSGWVYTNTLNCVTEMPKDMENFPELPAVNIYLMKETCQNTSAGFIQNAGLNKHILEMRFDVELWIYGQTEDRRAWSSGVLGDLKALFGNNSQLINEAGDTTAFNILYSSGESLLLNITRPNVVVHTVFTVRYRTNRINPSERM